MDDSPIDRAYRESLNQAIDSAEESAARERRRAKVLGAIEGLSAAQAAGPAHSIQTSKDRAAAVPASLRIRLSGFWRGAAAAGVLVCSSLLVLHLRDEAPAMNGGAFQMPTPDANPAPAAPANRVLPEQSPIPLAQARQPAVPAPAEDRVAPAAAAAPTPDWQARATEEARGTARRASESRRPEVTDSMARTETAAADAVAPKPAKTDAGGPESAVDNPAADGAARTAIASERRDVRAASSTQAGAERATAGPTANMADHVARAGKADSSASGAELLSAVGRGDRAAARRILGRTAADAGRDPDGRTALAIAVLRSDSGMIRLLLEHGADRLAKDRFGRTPVGYAEASGDRALIQAFHRPSSRAPSANADAE